jgi:hypothetical protein
MELCRVLHGGNSGQRMHGNVILMRRKYSPPPPQS